MGCMFPHGCAESRHLLGKGEEASLSRSNSVRVQHCHSHSGPFALFKNGLTENTPRVLVVERVF